MATIRLKDSYKAGNRYEPTHLLIINGSEGRVKVTTAESLEISAVVASRYYLGKHFDVVFTESDREDLLSLPERETLILTNLLNCRVEEIPSRLLPKKPVVVKASVPEMLKATAKKATKKITPKKTTPKKTTPKKKTLKEPVLEEE